MMWPPFRESLAKQVSCPETWPCRLLIDCRGPRGYANMSVMQRLHGRVRPPNCPLVADIETCMPADWDSAADVLDSLGAPAVAGKKEPLVVFVQLGIGDATVNPWQDPEETLSVTREALAHASRAWSVTLVTPNPVVLSG